MAKRYEMDCTMEPADNGAWVLAADHEAELAEKDREIERWREGASAWGREADQLRAKLTRCDELLQRAADTEEELDAARVELPGEATCVWQIDRNGAAWSVHGDILRARPYELVRWWTYCPYCFMPRKIEIKKASDEVR